MKLTTAVLATIVSTSALLAQCPTGTSYGSGDDFVANSGNGIAIGFPFVLDGVAYTHIHPASNGFIWLSTGGTITSSDLSPSTSELSSEAPRIAALWDDLNLQAANGAELLVDTSSGTECKVTWFNAINYNQPAPIFSLSATLFASGEVHLSYDANVVTATDAIVGISPGNGAPVSAAVDFSVPLPSADAMIYEEFVAGAFDLQDSTTFVVPTAPGYTPIYTPSTGSQCASSEEYGQGCGPNAAADLVHEFMSGGWDITNPVTFLLDATGYTMLDAIPATFVPPGANATPTVTADDGYFTVTLTNPMPYAGGTTNQLTICSNGYFSMSGNSPLPNAPWTTSVATFETFTEPTFAGPWYDWSPNAGGNIMFEEVGPMVYITWDAVPPFNSSGTDTWQFQLDTTSGTVTIVYDNMTMTGGSSWHTPLFGYTPGTGAGPTLSTGYDFSVDLASIIAINSGAQPLALSGNEPRVGGVFDMVTSNIDPISPISILMFSDQRLDPGVLLPTIGLDAPGCSVYLATILGTITGTNVGGSSTVSWTLPPTASSFIGLTVATQSVCLTTQNSLGLLTSNGFEGIIGF